MEIIIGDNKNPKGTKKKILGLFPRASIKIVAEKIIGLSGVVKISTSKHTSLADKIIKIKDVKVVLYS